MYSSRQRALAHRVAAFDDSKFDIPLSKIYADDDSESVPLHLVRKGEDIAAAAGDASAAFASAVKFKGSQGQACVMPGPDGQLEKAFFGIDDGSEPLVLGLAPGKLPPKTYTIAKDMDASEATTAALAWGLGSYKYTRLQKPSDSTEENKAKDAPSLVWPAKADKKKVSAMLEGMFWARDLINTPANLLGPEELEKEAEQMALQHGAEWKVTVGATLEKDFPLIHAVGKGSSRPPRLLEIKWGNPEKPKIALVGKGVVFDTGGYNIKPGGSMFPMKKDMGGAGAILGLTHMLMASGIDAHVHTLIPIAENSISGEAFRPSDVITSRSGITVEIGNTDAEGRLILADALSLADDDKPELILNMATLTGAHRVALGWDLPGIFTNDDEFAAKLYEKGESIGDPVWRLPLHKGYESYLKSKVADTSSTGSKGLAGAITAALFLKKFVPKTIENGGTWMHIDFAGWTDPRPGRPEGGEAQAIQASLW
eukprot:CAMPEP_0167759312 /NCGR_PEP_ID=MMETSP0110_2-20121227/10952_1 /TAXON_ID=629695 /ORGANISM="Gymnochlora sp., Strain CCMP2014" /LENGTH=482 /DNA_ID=CAMNT_0007645681 /DNA_START=26 /DNA_END=1471 /DNA_ORIENTATION=+